LILRSFPTRRSSDLAVAVRLCLRALQLARKPDRAEQGGLLPCLAANPGDDPHGSAELATLALVLSAGAGRTGQASEPKDRPRERSEEHTSELQSRVD